MRPAKSPGIFTPWRASCSAGGRSAAAVSRPTGMCSSCRHSAPYTGGLNIRDRAFAAVFGTRNFTAHMLGDNRLYAFAASRCLTD